MLVIRISRGGYGYGGDRIGGGCAGFYSTPSPPPPRPRRIRKNGSRVSTLNLIDLLLQLHHSLLFCKEEWKEIGILRVQYALNVFLYIISHLFENDTYFSCCQHNFLCRQKRVAWTNVTVCTWRQEKYIIFAKCEQALNCFHQYNVFGKSFCDDLTKTSIAHIAGILPVVEIVWQEKSQNHHWIFARYCCNHYRHFDVNTLCGHS